MIRWAAAAAFCMSLALVTTHAQQTPVFVSRSDIVRMDVLVTDRGRPVPGLKADDFRITDNGVPQKVEYLSFDELPLNVVMTFDVSASMVGPRLEDLRSAGNAVLDQLRKDDRAALVSFTEALSLGSPLTGDFASVRSALNRARAEGMTSLVDATFAGLVIGAADTGRSVMFVFSDGLDTSSWLSPAAVLDASKRASVVVFGVVIGQSRASFLNDLVELTGGDLVQVQASRDLRPTFVRLLAEYRQRYLVGYTPTGVAQTGWHKVDVTLARRGPSVKARPGYQGR